MVGIDAAIANAFRRILLAEVCLMIYVSSDCLYMGHSTELVKSHSWKRLEKRLSTNAVCMQIV